MWVLGNIRIPITVIIRQPFLKGQVPVRAVLHCPHLNGFHLMDSVDVGCLGHEPITVRARLCKPCHEVVIGTIVLVIQRGSSGQGCWVLCELGRMAAVEGHTVVVMRVDRPVLHPSRPAPGLGQGRTAAAQGHAVPVMTVDHPVAHPSQPAPETGQGWTAADHGHTMVVMGVDHPVAHPSQPAVGPGHVRAAVAQGQALVVMRVDHPLAHPSPTAPRPGHGRAAAAEGHTVVVQRG